MREATWGDIASRVIDKAVTEISSKNDDKDKMYQYISKNYYPFGERKHWPYKAWLTAIQRHKNGPAKKERKVKLVDPNQTVMF